MKRKSRKEFQRDTLPRGADLAAHSGASEPLCDYCKAPKRLHPIVNPRFPKTQPNRQYLCALDYTERQPTPLPFETRALDTDDKNEWQEYWDRRKGD